MIMLRSPLDVPVDLLAAQHPVEQEMIQLATLQQHYEVTVPIAPLGGVLLVKTKADRPKDRAALEQTAEHLRAAVLDRATAWAEERDPATAADMRSRFHEVRLRRTPQRWRR